MRNCGTLACKTMRVTAGDFTFGGSAPRLKCVCLKTKNKMTSLTHKSVRAVFFVSYRGLIGLSPNCWLKRCNKSVEPPAAST